MVAIKNLFNAFMATALITGTNALPAQAVGDVVNTLYTAANNYENLHNAVKAFDGQAAKYAAIKHNEIAVETSLQRAIDAANATAPLSDEDSKFVMQALAQPYPEFMGKLLDDIVAKKPQVDQVGKTTDMLCMLNNLKVLSKELPDALEEKLDAKDAEEIKSGEEWARGLFADAVKAYTQ
ncbi:hypothetical protein CNMCM5793_002362 [Aspergillus hiratsukae]|uniref:Cell wall protein n=1 Tax=Aspergillus hiratsukae TaxID=1194566 RepID=A0A8H6QG48_9EURO|nr:hypothetical protein CNMCM5793_002362 [Aspergillus hiratsukae]KAF7171632.1 hypothetical protein CNMCM6106_006043 [Aspergillus hiratsukae]